MIKTSSLPNVFQSALLLFLVIAFFSCTSTFPKQETKHYAEEMLQVFEKICDEQKSRDTGFYLIDSLYKTFPYISAVDKYRYYDFKRGLFELIRYDKRSYDTAIAYIDSSIAVIEDNKLEKIMSKEYLRAFTTRGDYYIRIQRYNYAIRDITRSKQLSQEAGDSCLMAENTKTLSVIAINQSNHSLAASLTKEALLLAASCKKDQQQFRRMQGYLNDLGYVYWGAEKLDSALFYYFAAEKYVKENKQLMEKDTLFPYEALENIYGNISFVSDLKKNYADAELYAKKTIAIDQDILHDSLKVAMSQYILGTIYFSSGRINEADAMAQKAIVYTNKFDIGMRADLWGLLAKIAREKKQHKEEADYREKWMLSKDTMYKGRIELLKKNPFTEYEQLDKKYQVELLKKDNRNQQNKTNAIIVIGILVTILAITSLFLIRRLRNVMKKRAIVFKKLAASENALKETMVQKERAEKALREKELFAQEMRLQMEFNESIIQQRRQISDDMHDELSSSLAALKFYIEDEKSKAIGTTAEKSLSDITNEVSSVYKNARSYMHSLKTNNWETRFSLTGFLKEIQQKFSEKALMAVKLDIDEENIRLKLSTQQHDQLYHIIRESIANVIKHAGATELSIAINFKNDECIFNITDNGIGFDKGNIVQGIGIESMQKRIKGIEGELTFNSFIGGTTINGFFPLY